MTNSKQLTAQQMKTEVHTQVMDKLAILKENKQISFPPNYSPENAIQSAWLILQDVEDFKKNKALEVCTKQSVANFFLDMVSQGLSLAKKQGYAICYGNTLTFTRSYFGTIAVLKRVKGFESIYAEVIREGENFKIGSIEGKKFVENHEPSFETMDNKIIGAFCVINTDEGSHCEVMTQLQIQKSWNQSKSKNQTVHKQFPSEMAKRTVINRACKIFVNTSDDSDLNLLEAFNKSTENEFVDNSPEEQSKITVDENANKKTLVPEDVEDGEYSEIVDQSTGEVKESSPESVEDATPTDDGSTTEPVDNAGF